MELISLNGNDWLFKEFLGMDWVWRSSEKPDTKDTRWWYNATVPGSVLNDLMENQKVPNPYYEMNSKLVEWVPSRTWIYKKSFQLPADVSGKQITIYFDGIDYNSEIFINGVSIGKQEGMFIPFSKEISGLLNPLEENHVAVVIEPSPQEQPQVGRTSLVKTHKTRMNYWWDFCPRMIHQGIWDSVYLKVTGRAMLTEVYVKSVLNDNYTQAILTVELETSNAIDCEITLQVDSKKVTKTIHNNIETLELLIVNPILWQPNGYGEPYQYEINLELRDQSFFTSDSRQLKFGIREIKFSPNENCNPSAEAFTLQVNGQRVYVSGYNWVPMDALYGVERRHKLQRLIQLAKEANIIMFRVWGGGLIEKDSFYEACARNGILIWQEFIQSSSGIDNIPSEDPAFMSMLLSQAEIIIRRKRNHTSLAIWCGGNELTDAEVNPIGNENPLIGKLKEMVEKLDPSRRWLPTSPSGGVFSNSISNIEEKPEQLIDVHGPWEHQGMERQYELYNRGTSLFHSEFGVEGMTNRNTLLKIISKEHMLPASKENEIYFHRGAWWANEPLVQEMFGGLDTIWQIKAASQYLQYEGLKYAVESNRRRAFQNSGTFPWQFNEPYPNLYCTSSLDYYGNPKPAYYGVQNSYHSILVSASFLSPSLYGRKAFDVTIYLSSFLGKEEIDRLGEVRLEYRLFGTDGTVYHSMSKITNLPENKSVEALHLILPLQDRMTELLLLRLNLYNKSGECLAENEYLFTRTLNYKPIFVLPEPKLNICQIDDSLRLDNQGDTAALYLFLSDNSELPLKEFLYFDKNYFCMMPGEVRKVKIYATQGSFYEKKVTIEHFDCCQEITLV